MSSANSQLCVDNCDGEKISGDSQSCIVACPTGHLASSVNNQRCHEKCFTFEFISIDNRSCLHKCPENEFIFESNCVNVCPVGTAVMSTVELEGISSGDWVKAGIIEDILNLYSRTCHRIICPKNKFLSSKKDSCISKCPADEVVSIDNRSCFAKCPENEYVFESKCVQVCPEGTSAESGDIACVLIPTPVPSPDPSPDTYFKAFSDWSLDQTLLFYIFIGFVFIPTIMFVVRYYDRKKAEERRRIRARARVLPIQP
jgi:hypothetical protein